MADDRYRPDQDVTFDLASGLVHLDGAPARVLVPADGLSALLAAAGAEAAAAFGRAIGATMGLRVAARLAAGAPGSSGNEGARAASVEAMVEQLGVEVSLAGLGSLGLERWGHALVIVIDHCPLGANGDGLLEAVTGAAIGAATGRHVHAVLLSREATRARLLLTNEAAAERVRGWLRDGASWGDALTRLHAPPAATGPRAA